MVLNVELVDLSIGPMIHWIPMGLVDLSFLPGSNWGLTLPYMATPTSPFFADYDGVFNGNTTSERTTSHRQIAGK